MKKTLAIMLGIALLGELIFIFFSQPKNEIPPEPVACTEEALQCPDGSYVGRSGSKCAFSACPSQSPIIGTLKQDANGFKLIISSPGNNPQEVSYSVPLILKVSNVVGQLVNQKVRVYGSFTEGATYAVDRLEELPGTEGDPTLGDVRIGKTAFVNGVRITVNKVVEDSRCAVDVTCIWAGRVKVNVTLKSNTDTETVDIFSDAAPHAFDSYKISLENTAPSRAASAPPTKESYVFTFRVVKK